MDSMNKGYNTQGKVGKVVLLCSIFVALGILLQYTSALRPLEQLILDQEFRTFTRPDPNDKIAMVAIDQKSLDYFAKNRMYWPWPREFYQIVTDYLVKEGAELIVFDIYFDTPDFDRVQVDGETSDRRFANSLKQAGNALLAVKTTGAGETTEALIPRKNDTTLSHWDISGTAPNSPFALHRYTSIPIPIFREAAAGFGNTDLLTDSDAVIRRVKLFDSTATDGYVPTLAMSAYLHMNKEQTGTAPDLSWTPNGLEAGSLNIPLTENGSYLINWYRKGGVKEGTFPYYSYKAVVESAVRSKQPSDSANLPIPRGTFEDKVVFIGASATGLADIKSTPMSGMEAYPGMEIHATVLNNLIDEGFLHRMPGWAAILVLILLAAGVGYLTAYNRPIWGIISTAALLFLTIAVGLWLFSAFRFALPLGLFFTHGLLTFTGVIVYKYFSEERQKKQIKGAFSQYVQPEYVDQVVQDPEKLRLGGDKKELTVMFSDVAGFTSISESMPPEKLVSFLNEYLTSMTRIVFEHGGTLDKYIGDAIMAFWGAPIEHSNTAVAACRSTLRMIDVMNELVPQWKARGHPHVFARYGINTGPMIVGNMGSENRFNYTVLGDAVNLAARLEPANKEFGTTTMISEFTHKKLNDDFLCRQLDLLVVKGKTQPVKVYELIADRSSGKQLDTMERAVDIYTEGLNFYYEKQWDKAIAKFDEVLKQIPDDGPAQTYKRRCQEFKAHPPETDWDGVYRLLKK